MRIAHRVEWSGFQGGAERVAYDIALGLRNRGHQNLLVADQDTGPQHEQFLEVFDQCLSPGALEAATGAPRADAVLVHRAPSATALRHLATRFKVACLVHDVSVTCPRTHRMFPLGAAACHRRAGLGCAPCFLLPGRDRRGRLGPLPVLENARLRAAIRDLPASIVPSRYLRTLLLQHGWHSERVHVIPPARVDLNPAYSTPGAQGTVLFVGALNRGKGPDLLLSALMRTRGWSRLDIVGTGKWEHALKRLTRIYNLEDRVVFHGRLSAGQVSERYRQADIVAFPSRAPESFGLVGLEAMAHGRPVVAFDLGGVSQWLVPDQTGLAVPPGNVVALSDALGRLLGDPDLAATLGRNGRREWHQRFDTNRFIDGVERVLGHLVITTGAISRGAA